MAEARHLHLGLDFDNTIVSYDTLFHRVAREMGLISDDVTVSKNAVRDFLRTAGREPEWTAMQGMLAAHERDRKLIAFEIHDGLVQTMAGALPASR